VRINGCKNGKFLNYCDKNQKRYLSARICFLETMRMRGRPRNRWQGEVREDRRLVGGIGWKKRVYNSGEWKKPLRRARNRCILHMAME
jgi:hypothetical protein